MKGYVYVPFLLLILVAFGFVLSGGFILSEESSSTTESTDQYTLVEETGSSSNQTLQILTLKGQVIPTPTTPIPPVPNLPQNPVPNLPQNPVPNLPQNPVPPTSNCIPDPNLNCAHYGLSEGEMPCRSYPWDGCKAILCYGPCTANSCVKKTCEEYGLSRNTSCSSDPQPDGCGSGISCYNCSIPTQAPVSTQAPVPPTSIPTKGASYQ